MKKICIVAAFIALAPFSARALARAPFPNGKNLQPIPQDVAPNISGNVDSSLQPAYTPPAGDTYNEQSQTGDENAPSQSAPQSAALLQGPNLWLFLGIAVLFFVVSGFWLLRRK